MKHDHRFYTPFNEPGEPVEAMPLESYEAMLERDARVIALTRRIGRFFAKVEITLVIAFALYFLPQIYAGLARQGVLPW